MIRSALLAFALAMFPSRSQAATPVERGFAVGGVSLGAEVLLGGGLAAAGFGIGNLMCDPSVTECFFPIIGGAAGGTLGAIVGAPLGGAIAAGNMHARGGRVVLFSSLGLVTGLGIAVLGPATNLTWPKASGTLVTTGVIFAATSMPVLAGVAAATDRKANSYERRIQMSVVPTLRPDRVGLRVSVVGF